MSHYEDLLSELREKGSMLANKYIVELYNVLRDEEKLPAEDCRAKIEHDCVDLWSKATIRKYLPPESKDAKKQKAGKIGAAVKAGENRNSALLLVDGEDANGARINLAENGSVSQNEQELTTFHNDLDQKLSERLLSPALLQANKMIAERDRKIEELEKENNSLKYKDGFRVHKIAIDYVFRIAKEIREKDKEKDYLHIIAQGSDVLGIVDHMPQSDEEIQELLG